PDCTRAIPPTPASRRRRDQEPLAIPGATRPAVQCQTRVRGLAFWPHAPQARKASIPVASRHASSWPIRYNGSGKRSINNNEAFLMLFFDPLYFLILAPGILLALWAQIRVQRAYSQASQIPARSGYTGAQAADALLHAAGVPPVQIEPVEGFMSDHYVPGKHVLRLSPQVY